MNPEQDCKSIRRQAMITFCHDFASFTGTFTGYSEIFSLIANKELSFDNVNITDMLHKLRRGEQNSDSDFTTMTNDMKSSLKNCEKEFSDIIDSIHTAYQDDFKAWYSYLEQLETHFLETDELDIELTDSLLHHAGNLTQFITNLRQEVAQL